MITVLVGLQWGDEGKGRMVDYLAADADIVSRYQGGNNAGHTVVNEYGTHKLHLVPSGIFYPDVINVLGPGMVIDIEALSHELDELTAAGIDVSNIRISDRATVTFPFHRLEDNLEEERLGGSAFGSTRRGIAYAYGERYMKKSIMIGELLYPDYLARRISGLVEWKNLVIRNVYGADENLSADSVMHWLEKFGDKIKQYICDTTALMESAAAAGKNILFEAQLGSLRDIYFGIYPFTTSSSTLASFAPVGGGLFNRRIDKIIGVMKSFSTCVGAGPFVTEMPEDLAGRMREIALEYGASTGRPRRIGHFDAVAARYGARVQGVDEIAMTKLDSLSGQDSLLICTHYEIDGIRTSDFPVSAALDSARPVYEEMKGWQDEISDVREFDKLPAEARKYVLRIEELLGYPVKYVSVGPERESLILR